MTATALLAPVPLEHLMSAMKVCEREGSVLFGSNAWQLFESEALRAGMPVYIYASRAGAPVRPMITWHAEYVGFVRSEALSAQMRRRRPPSTANDTPFGGYYEVRDLRELANNEVFEVTDLADADGRPYRSGFIPEGPIAVRG
jgi:hypothetical protein